MRRVKLIVVLIGLFTLTAVGCDDATKSTGKSGTPANKAEPAEGSGY